MIDFQEESFNIDASRIDIIEKCKCLAQSNNMDLGRLWYPKPYFQLNHTISQSSKRSTKYYTFASVTSIVSSSIEINFVLNIYDGGEFKIFSSFAKITRFSIIKRNIKFAP